MRTSTGIKKWCPECFRKVSILQDGRMIKHKPVTYQTAKHSPCPGWKSNKKALDADPGPMAGSPYALRLAAKKETAKKQAAAPLPEPAHEERHLDISRESVPATPEPELDLDAPTEQVQQGAPVFDKAKVDQKAMDEWVVSLYTTADDLVSSMMGDEGRKTITKGEMTHIVAAASAQADQRVAQAEREMAATVDSRVLLALQSAGVADPVLPTQDELLRAAIKVLEQVDPLPDDTLNQLAVKLGSTIADGEILQGGGHEELLQRATEVEERAAKLEARAQEILADQQKLEAENERLKAEKAALEERVDQLIGQRDGSAQFDGEQNLVLQGQIEELRTKIGDLVIQRDDANEKLETERQIGIARAGHIQRLTTEVEALKVTEAPTTDAESEVYLLRNRVSGLQKDLLEASTMTEERISARAALALIDAAREVPEP